MMLILSQPVIFEWDAGNVDKNWIKHSVTYQEAEEVFGNEPLLLLIDEGHSKQEKRYNALGKSDGERLLFVSFTIRINRVRVISIRQMNRKEKIQYQNVVAEKRLI